MAQGITSLGAAVESTVISTALPRIAETPDAKELYAWFANAYAVTRSVTVSNVLLLSLQY
ncbi:hypothetical protein RRF57_013262 [Xylaria bambusicola]|uniref:Uncharacterized protein n=1 Tax=Xylaria bambusicola TaxID=326684 RepID=A0AAN7ZBI3_9PEZI